MGKVQTPLILSVYLPALTIFLVIKYKSEETKEKDCVSTSDSLNDKLYSTDVLPYSTFLLKKENV
jgi:hypothetical protein